MTRIRHWITGKQRNTKTYFFSDIQAMMKGKTEKKKKRNVNSLKDKLND